MVQTVQDDSTCQVEDCLVREPESQSTYSNKNTGARTKLDPDFRLSCSVPS